ncbi:hypothetical protein [Noviherbaspirillum sp. UKPF54]|uniref:hypothetical protein n=1 Tax=Noviherbaspirillum sp. UKPF54 TaxID=2601898 RepID=UPI0011B192E2|nr:hypothetical protein [Noviherbaspirillum sp. UKPF54]QDZ28030.1 hypothetical protein FAY22_08770 [Noviherbaspirillum sp. UKPF54]
MQRVLSFEQTPALTVPLRFFLTAPLFAVAAAVVLLWQGPDALATRWSPAALALTHLLTLGFLASAMTGALLQILSVVAGVNIPRPRTTSAAIHASLTLGAAALALGFLIGTPSLFQTAVPLLLGAFGTLLVVCAYGLWRAPGRSDMITAIRFALAALGITVVLGASAASLFAWQLPVPLQRVVQLHVAWGLLGWVGLLVIGVAYQVVPMFQVTPVYPQSVTRWLSKVLFASLGIWSVIATLSEGRHTLLNALSSELLYGGFAVFGATTLYLLWHRKRPKPDPTTLFWRTSLLSLLACMALWIFGELLPQFALSRAFPFLLGILFIVGFAYSVVNGMLYKIVPFLVWYHLQNQLSGGCAKAPNVKQVLPDSAAEKQFRAHIVALVLLIASAIWPHGLAYLAAAAFGLSSGWLWLNLMTAARVYRRFLAQASASPAVA